MNVKLTLTKRELNVLKALGGDIAEHVEKACAEYSRFSSVVITTCPDFTEDIWVPLSKKTVDQIRDPWDRIDPVLGPVTDAVRKYIARREHVLTGTPDAK